MDPRKNARRGYAQRQARKTTLRRSESIQAPYPLKEGEKMFTSGNPHRTRNFLFSGCGCLVILGILFLCVLVAGFVFWPRTPAVTNPQPTMAPVYEATPAAPAVTVPDVVPTPVPMPVSCNTPSIKAGTTAADVEYGEFLDTTLGKRMTFTNRKVVVPAKAWNEPLTPDELKTVETTWLYIQVCVPEGMSGTIFAGGFEQGLNRYENGVLMTLQPGVYEFNLRNGEIVLWYPQQDEFSAKDLTRIVEQIRNGNFDIKTPLAFFGVTSDLLPSIPAELVKERNVQIIPFPEPVTK